MTVSYSLRDHASIPRPTRDRVKAAATKLGYRPNSAARAMLSGRFRAVASVYTMDNQGVKQTTKSDLLAGYNLALHEDDMQLILTAIDPSKLSAAKNEKPKLLVERMVDGLLIDYDVRISQELMVELAKLKIPFICVNDKRESDCVFPDDFGGAQAATEHLLSVGHRKILCYLFQNKLDYRGDPVHYSVADRVAGYSAAMKEAGAAPRIVGPNAQLEIASEQVRALVGASDRPTAVLCTGSEHPMMFLHHAQMAGLKIPRDLSIATLYHEQPETLAPVATWHIPFRETGYAAAKQIQKKTEAPSAALAPLAIPYTKISLGATIAAPKKRK